MVIYDSACSKICLPTFFSYFWLSSVHGWVDIFKFNNISLWKALCETILMVCDCVTVINLLKWNDNITFFRGFFFVSTQLKLIIDEIYFIFLFSIWMFVQHSRWIWMVRFLWVFMEIGIRINYFLWVNNGCIKSVALKYFLFKLFYIYESFARVIFFDLFIKFMWV